ncbi:MAG TPA: hypothetical protein VK509_14795 [Polyangiales bacterium]|nr:hypothetical protein [Polyangiales bacterium]
MVLRAGSFNVQGIKGRDVRPAVDGAAGALSPSDPCLWAVGFQEVFFAHQANAIRERWLGAGASALARTNLTIWRNPQRTPWRALVPITTPVNVPGFAFELSSGLVLCVQGTVADSFFQRFRGGYFPDKVASKGLLCALVRRGGERRAFIATHFHNGSSDRFGGARAHQVEQLASAVKWIDANWRAPIAILGDFNIDSLAAYKSTSDVERTLYSRLAVAGRSRDRPHFDVNAQCNGFMPIATSTDGKKTLDKVLLSAAPKNGSASFKTSDHHSDHHLIWAQWEG